jgi:hypothetical protein
MAVLPSGPGRCRTCTVPGKSRELCRLSYGAQMVLGVAGRDRTCGAPRFRRALCRLSYGHRMGEAGVEPAASCFYDKRSRRLSYSPASSGTRTRTSISTFRAWRPSCWTIPDRPTRDGRRARHSPCAYPRFSVHLFIEEIDAVARLLTSTELLSRSARSRAMFPSRSPTLRPWINDRRSRISVDRRPTWRSFGARVSHASEKIAS